MTLFTKNDCKRCDQLKKRFDLRAMEVQVEVLDGENSDALAHLAWHSLVEAARKSLPLLVLDDCSTVLDYDHIENHLLARASQYGLIAVQPGGRTVRCQSGSCALH